MNSKSIEELLYTKEFEELSKLLEIIFRKSLEYSKIKNISMDDVGKNYSIFPEIKISFETFPGWESNTPKEGKKTQHYTEDSGVFMIFIPKNFKMGVVFIDHENINNFALYNWREEKEKLYQIDYELKKEENTYLITDVNAAGVVRYQGDLALAQGRINYDEELEFIKKDINKIKLLLTQ
jgi:hypothetical protein